MFPGSVMWGLAPLPDEEENEEGTRVGSKGMGEEVLGCKHAVIWVGPKQ